MNGVVARLAHVNRLLHLLCCEGALPPILSMAMSGYQMMFAVNFVDPTELAQHENLFRTVSDQGGQQQCLLSLAGCDFPDPFTCLYEFIGCR